MDFSSDNVAGIAPEILAAMAAANGGRQPSYGEDAVTRRVERRLAAIFEHEVAVFPVATGTAANALALARREFSLDDVRERFVSHLDGRVAGHAGRSG